MKKVVFISVLTIAIFSLKSVSGLRCYGCSLPDIPDNDHTADLTCLNAPANASKIISCPPEKKFCIIIRNDYTESGNIASLVRTCIEKPPLINDDIEAPNYITHYRSCQTDLCNDGNGITKPGGTVDGNGNGGIGGILVPDEYLNPGDSYD